MIRAATASGWMLVTHPDHAALAGEFARAFGNDRFAPPEPFPSVHYAVAHHDDGWLARDATPSLTREGKPEAFTRALVGAYSAFEEIDLPSYLRVRGEATAAVAARDPYAGILVSMHTVNLLTEQADLDTIRPEHRETHAAFVAGQRDWQAATAATLGADPAALDRGFKFLQACDNLSLIACAGYDQVRDLRHHHPDRDGRLHAFQCRPAGLASFTIDPWPFAESTLTFDLPCRELPASACCDLDAFRAAFATAPVLRRVVTLRSP